MTLVPCEGSFPVAKRVGPTTTFDPGSHFLATTAASSSSWRPAGSGTQPPVAIARTGSQRREQPGRAVADASAGAVARATRLLRAVSETITVFGCLHEAHVAQIRRWAHRHLAP